MKDHPIKNESKTSPAYPSKVFTGEEEKENSQIVVESCESEKCEDHEKHSENVPL